MAEGPEGSEERSLGQQLLLLAGAGMQLTASIAGAALLGWWLDQRLGTKPWLLLVLILAGTAGGFLAFMRALQIANRSKG